MSHANILLFIFAIIKCFLINLKLVSVYAYRKKLYIIIFIQYKIVYSSSPPMYRYLNKKYKHKFLFFESYSIAVDFFSF